MKIRKATKKDAEALAKLYLQFWDAHKSPSPLHEPKIKINYENLLKDARKTVKYMGIFTYVAEENSEIKGYITFLIKISESYFRIKKYGYVDEVVVDKLHRGKGISRELINFAINFLKKKRVRYVQLKVEVKNEIAKKTWEKLGFKRDSIEYIKEIR